MPLGNQFQNTYHYDAQNNLHIWTDTGVHKPVHTVFTPEDVQKHIEEHGHHPLGGSEGVPHQGMLFDPYMGTGHKNDPLIPREQRRAEIQRAFHLTPDDPKAYQKNTQQYGAKRPLRDIPSDIEEITKTAEESGIPHHIFTQLDNPVVLYPKPGRAFVGGMGHYMQLKGKYRDQEHEYVRVPRHAIGEMLVNPNAGNDYHAAIAKHLGTDKELNRLYSTDLNEFPTHPESQKNPALEGTRASFTMKSVEGGFDSLKGHAGTLWPGKGEETDEYTVQPVQMRTHKLANSWNDGKTWFHRRYAKGDIINFRSKKVITNPGVLTPQGGAETIAHETGHLLDPNVKRYTWYGNHGGEDTAHEAVADGIRDRFHFAADTLERALEPSPGRVSQMKSSGYTTNHKHVSGTPLRKALYAAIRQHVSMGDNNYLDIPHQDDLAKASGFDHDKRWDTKGQKEGNIHTHKLMLGQLYTHHAHVREILHHMGPDMANEGKQAAEYYRTQITDAGREHPDAHQPTLPGFENL